MYLLTRIGIMCVTRGLPKQMKSKFSFTERQERLVFFPMAKFDISLGPGSQTAVGTNTLYLSQVNVWDRIGFSPALILHSTPNVATLG